MKTIGSLIIIITFSLINVTQAYYWWNWNNSDFSNFEWVPNCDNISLECTEYWDTYRYLRKDWVKYCIWWNLNKSCTPKKEEQIKPWNNNKKVCKLNICKNKNYKHTSQLSDKSKSRVNSVIKSNLNKYNNINQRIIFLERIFNKINNIESKFTWAKLDLLKYIKAELILEYSKIN